jgi:hypothetical protein
MQKISKPKGQKMNWKKTAYPRRTYKPRAPVPFPEFPEPADESLVVSPLPLPGRTVASDALSHASAHANFLSLQAKLHSGSVEHSMSEATLKRVRIEVTQAFAGLLLAMKDLHSKGLVDEDYLMALLAKD